MADPAFVLSNWLNLTCQGFLLALKGGCLLPVAHRDDPATNTHINAPSEPRSEFETAALAMAYPSARLFSRAFTTKILEDYLKVHLIRIAVINVSAV